MLHLGYRVFRRVEQLTLKFVNIDQGVIVIIERRTAVSNKSYLTCTGGLVWRKSETIVSRKDQ